MAFQVHQVRLWATQRLKAEQQTMSTLATVTTNRGGREFRRREGISSAMVRSSCLVEQDHRARLRVECFKIDAQDQEQEQPILLKMKNKSFCLYLEYYVLKFCKLKFFHIMPYLSLRLSYLALKYFLKIIKSSYKSMGLNAVLYHLICKHTCAKRNLEFLSKAHAQNYICTYFLFKKPEKESSKFMVLNEISCYLFLGIRAESFQH